MPMIVPTAPTAASVPSLEWLKILMSAIAGMMTGLIAEPIKVQIQNFFLVRRITRAIHYDFVKYEDMLKMCLDRKFGEIDTFIGVFNRFRFEAYEFFLEKHKELFLSNKKLILLEGLIKEQMSLASVVDGEMFTLESSAQTGLNHLKDAKTVKLLDLNVLARFKNVDEQVMSNSFFFGTGELTPEEYNPTRRTRTLAWLRRISSQLGIRSRDERGTR